MSRSLTSRKHIFYVYAILDPRKPGPFYYGHWKFKYEPFYIGKGKDKRTSIHFKEGYSSSNRYKINKMNKIYAIGLEPLLIIKRKKLTEKQAFRLETKLIKKIGRADLGLGPLTNLTNGGDGTSGIIPSKESIIRRAAKLRGRKHSKETCQKISEANTGRIRSREHCEAISKANLGKKHTKAWRKRMSKLMTGRKFTLEWRTNISKSAKNRPKRFLSEETKIKISKALKGRIPSVEHRINLSKSRQGMLFSKEHRANLSKARKAYLQQTNKESR